MVSESFLLADYNAQIAAGTLRFDPAQQTALAALDQLCQQLQAGETEERRLIPNIVARLRRGTDTPIKGLYLHGPVGRGKSMVMDLFFAHAPVVKKRRVHFHAFMQEVHVALFDWRQKQDHGADPLPLIAQAIARENRLLCFDEFYVADIADAMILARLFTALFAAGVVLVATSNTAPDDLYAGGLQRANFLPFISILKQHVTVMEVAGSLDHRMAFLRGHQVYFTPLDGGSSRSAADLFSALTNHAATQSVTLTVQGREVVFTRAAHGVLWTSYAELCERALGAADYLAVARHFRAVVLENVPQFRADQRNETMRFITLVDALYEARTKLVMTAQVTPEELYPAGLHAVMFNRTASRLHEMQGAAYLAGI
jgi:cell division protein ZapE